MDLSLAGAGEGAGVGLQQLIMRQLLEKQIAQQDQQFQLKQQELAQRDREMADARNEANKNRQQAITLRRLEAIPSGTDLPEAQVKSTFGDEAIGRFQPLNTLASTQFNAGGTMPGESSAAPATPVQATSVPAQSTGLLRKLPSDVELERQSRDAATAAQRDFTNKLSLRRIADTEGNAAGSNDLGWFKAFSAANLAAQNAGEKGWKLEKATGPDGKDTWVRINQGTGEIKPTSASDFRPPASATTRNRADSAQAVNQVGNDIIAELKDPKVAAVLGPVLGRYSNLQDFIGNPPPEFSKLAGEIESYSLANMGVHGMRSAQGAQQIQHLLTAKHTPESLIAAIQGLQTFSTHFMQNQGMQPAGTPAPNRPQPPRLSADELIKKYAR